MMQRSSATSLLLLAMVAVVVPACTDDGEQNPPAHGGAADFTFAGNSGSNLDTSPLPPTDVGVVFADPASQTRVIGVFAFEPQLDGYRRKAWQLALSIAGDPVAGASYTIGSAPNTGSATLMYDQFPTEGSWLSWQATAGTMTVDSVSGTTATFSFSSIPMVPTTAGSGNQATGSFTFSGTITVDNIGP
jgi:hypothetical protein